MAVHIRPATKDDAPALSRICLLTADAGASGAPNHSRVPGADFPGNVYAVPYVHLSPTFGFALVDPNVAEHDKQVVGYILGATDTRAFEAAADAEWYPALRKQFPLSLGEEAFEDDANDADNSRLSRLTPEDRRYIRLFHKPDRAYDVCVAFSPAHLHINILPEYQRQGWGRRLIGRAVAHLREQRAADGSLLEGIWLAMDPRNTAAATFYEHLGFVHVKGAPKSCVGLRFDQWKD